MGSRLRPRRRHCNADSDAYPATYAHATAGYTDARSTTSYTHATTGCTDSHCTHTYTGSTRARR